MGPPRQHGANDETPTPTPPPKPRPPGLANAFWGAGIKYQKLTPDQRRSVSRLYMVLSLVTATGVGVLVGVMGSPAAGAIWAFVTLVLVGVLTRSALRDFE